MTKYCRDCGQDITHCNRYGGLCQSCWTYYRKGGKVHPLPPKGVIAKDSRGYIVCHICGKAYKRLGSHAKEKHHMSIAEYKAKFELCNNAKTTESNYSQHMSKLAYKYDMDKQLIEAGKDTRIAKGQRHMRLGKATRLQERIDKHNRMINGGL